MESNKLYSEYVSVRKVERFLSVVTGVVLLSKGLKFRSTAGLLIALMGASLLYCGMTGSCAVSRTLGLHVTNAELKRRTQAEARRAYVAEPTATWAGQREY